MTTRRGVLKISGGALLAAATAGVGATEFASASGVPSSDIDPMSLVDPELRPMALEIEKNSAQFPSLSDETLPSIRAKIESLMLPPLPDVSYAKQQIPGSAGSPDVTVYILNAKPGTSRPGIVFLHGGGFVFGSALSALRDAQVVAAQLDCCVAVVDYRLAPETRFGGSIADNYTVLVWLHTHASELGVDPARIAIMGESAGGGHAALLAITARDRGEVPVAFQVLIYPMLDDRTGSSRQMPNHIGALVWRADANRYGWRSFLGQAPGKRIAPAGAVPARIADLTGLAPAFIGVGTLDLFVSEDIDYARRLVEAGVPTELLVVPGAFHGFDHNATAAVSKRFNEGKLDALRRAFGAPSRS